MAKHEVVIHENNGATKDVAPYTGSYIVKETVKLGSFIGEIAKQCGLPAIQVEAILTGAFEIIEELEQQSLVRIHTDIGTVCGIITGSFPTSDAAFDPDRNALELALRLDEEVKNALADVVPYIAQDDSLTKLRVDNVMDLATPRPYNLIHGQHPFRVAGFNMVLDDEGAEAYLTNALGTTFELVIDEVISKQLFVAHTAALLPAGDYKLVVKSRAGDAEGPLQTAFRRVKYMRIVEPEITGVEKETVRLEPGEGQAILGTRLTELFGEGSWLTIVFNPKGGEPDHMVTIEQAEGTLTDERYEFSLQKIIESIDADEEKPADGTEIAIEANVVASGGSLIDTVRFTAVYVAHG